MTGITRECWDRVIPIATSPWKATSSTLPGYTNEHASVIIRLDGAPVVDRAQKPDADGTLRLLADTARVAGPNLATERYEDPDGTNVTNLGFWNNTVATATWEAVFRRAPTR